MGLGSMPTVSLQEARKQAQRWQQFAKSGIDPIKQRERERKDEEKNLNVLSDVAHDCFEARKRDLKGDGKAGRWFSPLELHVLPKLGGVPIVELDQRDIRDALSPIWHDKPATAKKAMNRLGICMKHGAALGLEVDLQATEKARALLGAQRHQTQHTPFMLWQDIPAFYASLESDTITHLALKLLILTVGTRTSPVRHLRLEYIQDDVWIVPADQMKGRVGKTSDFRVPLSRQALDIIERAKPTMRDGFLFPNLRKGVISDATMSRLMERRGIEARPHGFRSSFRTWCAEETNTPREIAETCLAHVAGGRVERSYRRTDYLDQRRTLMQRWADLVSKA